MQTEPKFKRGETVYCRGKWRIITEITEEFGVNFYYFDPPLIERATIEPEGKKWAAEAGEMAATEDLISERGVIRHVQ